MEIYRWDPSEFCPSARRVQLDYVVFKDALIDGVGNGKRESPHDAAVPQDARIVRQRKSLRLGLFAFDEPEQTAICGEAAVLDAGESRFLPGKTRWFEDAGAPRYVPSFELRVEGTYNIYTCDLWSWRLFVLAGGTTLYPEYVNHRQARRNFHPEIRVCRAESKSSSAHTHADTSR